MPAECLLRKFRLRGQQDLADHLPFTEVIKLENAIHDHTIQYLKCRNLKLVHFKSIYNSKVQDICYNLDPFNSPTLLINILNKKIEIEKVPYLSPEELNPDNWESIIKKKEFIEHKKNNYATSDAYECRKCKQRKCSVYSIQTRSADEPMTLFIQCEVCNHSWKIYS